MIVMSIFLKKISFTLIEILIAIGIFVAVITIVGTIFRGALLSYQEAQVLAQRCQSLKRVFWVISRELSSALRANEEIILGEGEIFKGDKYSLFFVYPDSEGLKEIGYIFLPEKKSLIRRKSKCDFNFDTFDKGEVLSSNIESLNFSFFDGEKWKSSYKELPLAVKVELTLSYKGRRENYQELINIPVGR
ncbi:MAG: hypothetical protein DRP80_02415 [Candidatus Omnitrophota bacterium]|nr:MAG: hypothetical protein DRP69_02805 [Candidatus Omnitrophota bacterium]RKY44424.1 MAG: hypothetical protein DRP80_02415 [Candidatus Omnitrophota bacterium]